MKHTRKVTETLTLSIEEVKKALSHYFSEEFNLNQFSVQVDLLTDWEGHFSGAKLTATEEEI